MPPAYGHSADKCPSASCIEGMNAGADDYKPFSARELFAGVEAQLKMSRYRSAIAETLRSSEERIRASVTASSDIVYRMSPDWSEMRHLQGKDFIADTLNPSRGWLEKYIHPDDQAEVKAARMDTVPLRLARREIRHRLAYSYAPSAATA
jgi:hypothetical protein